MEEGIATSATLMVNMPDSLNAARRLKERSIPAGIHINLSEGSPLTAERDVHSLLDTRGYFLGKQKLRTALDEGSVDPTHIEREARAQIEWFLESCGFPTHVDGHHHVHVHPIIAPLLAPILSRYGIRFVRIPQESISERDPWELTKERRMALENVTKQAGQARPIFAAEDVMSTDHYRGLAMVGNAGSKRLRSLIAALPEGTTELMVHPGMCDPMGDDFSRDPQRETERNMLLDPDMRSYIKSRGVELIGFGDL